MVFVDWLIVFALLSAMVAGVVVSKKHMSSVADYLSAGRTAGRYLVSVSSGIASLGAITIVAQFEMNFQAGFNMQWWGFSHHFFIVLMAASGWVMYRFRETRALTLAQYFEMRYSRKFRIFAGIMAFIAGILNFGIFPSIGARFFMYYLDLPISFAVLGIEISTFAFLMVLLLLVAIYFVFAGGQVAVLVTDFIQGIFVSLLFVVVCFYFFSIFSFDQIFTAVQTAPEDASMINPFKTSQAEDFNFWYYFFIVLGVWYGPLSWQGAQGINSSAKDAHEAKMGQVLSFWRLMPQIIFLVFIPICAYTVLNHADFLGYAAGVNSVLDGVESGMNQSQLTVPLVLRELLPIGFMGGFAAVMIAAFISTHDTYLHSWATIFIQDVVMPLRKKPLTKEEHINWIRYTIVGVAIFIFFFSLFYKPNQYILLFFGITGSIFMSGAGAAIVFGLYWRKGTTAGAWSAMIVGATISVAGLILNQTYDNFFINEVWFGGIAMISSCIAYVVGSLVSLKEPFNLEKMLHRGEYALEGEHTIVTETVSRGWKLLGVGREFTKFDKLIYIGSYIWIFFWLFAFLGGTITYFTIGIEDITWMKFWYLFLGLHLIAAIIVVVWFSIGGVKDIGDMFLRLRTQKKDVSDDGQIRR